MVLAMDKPAPGQLGLVQDFVNSVHLPDGPDHLGTAPDAAGWLREHGARVARLSEAERSGLVEAREALRSLLQGNAGHPIDPSAISMLTAAFNGAALGAVISANGVQLASTAGGVPGFLGRISAAMVEATVAGTWRRLKVCRDDDCRWAFYDHSKNGSGVWCSMDSCGCRAKARAYRARTREAVTQPRA